MANEEKRKNEKKYTEKFCDTSCCGWQGMPEMMAKCCEGTSGTEDCSSMMAKCMNKCRWFPLIPVVFGVVLFTLGYYLDAEVTRILWMVAAGFLMLMGTFGFMMMNLSKRTCC